MTEALAFGAALKLLRTARGLTLEKLAHAAGLDARTLGRIERGHCRSLPQPATRERLAGALGVSVEGLSQPQPEE